MKRLFIVLVMFISVLAINAQVVEKTFADLKNEGNAAIKIKDFAKALDLYEQALIKNGTTPIADTTMIFNMGYCAYSAKNYEKALKYFDQSFAEKHMRVSSLLYKSDTYKAMKNDDESLKAMEAALAIAPADAKVKGKLASYYVKAATVSYSKGGDIINKANAEVTAGKLKPNDAAYKTALQTASVEFKKAMPLIEKALGFDPNNATAKQLKAACQEALK
jgi:tetratricopeptide (TPR) repeat protein